MSKIMDALRRADEERQASGRSPLTWARFVQAIKQELREELRQMEEAFSRRRAQQAEAQRLAMPDEGPHGRLSPPVAPAREGAASPAPSAALPTADSWERAIERVKEELESCERELARQNAETLHIKAQLASTEQLIAHLTQQQAGLQQRLAELDRMSTTLNEARGSWQRQLEALRECQLLSHAAKMAERELAANTVMVKQIADSQQGVSDELAHYEQRGALLQQHIDRIRFELSKALAWTGTTDPALTEPRGADEQDHASA